MDLKKPYKFKGTNNIGCLLIHGFTSTPAVMYPLAQVLKKEGYTVKAVLLSGHGTKPEDLLDVSLPCVYKIPHILSVFKPQCCTIITIPSCRKQRFPAFYPFFH